MPNKGYQFVLYADEKILPNTQWIKPIGSVKYFKGGSQSASSIILLTWSSVSIVWTGEGPFGSIITINLPKESFPNYETYYQISIENGPFVDYGNNILCGIPSNSSLSCGTFFSNLFPENIWFIGTVITPDTTPPVSKSVFASLVYNFFHTQF